MIEPTLFKLRVRYIKQGRLRYLGHLEVLHTIERIVRRAQMPYAVTQGFSPHMRAAFSSALPVGTSSVCEWFDIVLTAYIPADVALERLEAAAPPDLKPVEAGYVDMRADALTACITRVAYRLTMRPQTSIGMEKFSRALRKVCDEGEIGYRRGNKMKTLDIARTLVSHSFDELEDGTWALTLDTRISNEGAMRPELLIAAADRLCDPAASADEGLAIGVQHYRVIRDVAIERVAQWCETDDGELVSPLARTAS